MQKQEVNSYMHIAYIMMESLSLQLSHPTTRRDVISSYWMTNHDFTLALVTLLF